jgi:hypothetical protein
MACQIPFRSGFPSAVRGALYVEFWAATGMAAVKMAKSAIETIFIEVIDRDPDRFRIRQFSPKHGARWRFEPADTLLPATLILQSQGVKVKRLENVGSEA